jgi:phosphoheptose isomerase
MFRYQITVEIQAAYQKHLEKVLLLSNGGSHLKNHHLVSLEISATFKSRASSRPSNIK